ncbi:hypothetical protein EVAR_81963_1 [Eumeta japonica]|uniref:Uncharacterized protein n=1 Tax=Eumeta variegata TaxID=151549 RepID=A0A4C1VUV4_EUMVA|nr:hypothetical protein EVAR_81963_1 [Eumeta japonica]
MTSPSASRTIERDEVPIHHSGRGCGKGRSNVVGRWAQTGIGRLGAGARGEAGGWRARTPTGDDANFCTTPFFFAVIKKKTSNGSWIYCYVSGTKRQSAEWVFPLEELPTKVERVRSVGEKMVPFFFEKTDHCGMTF